VLAEAQVEFRAAQRGQPMPRHGAESVGLTFRNPRCAPFLTIGVLAQIW
jgi:hypothetical protein